MNVHRSSDALAIASTALLSSLLDKLIEKDILTKTDARLVVSDAIGAISPHKTNRPVGIAIEHLDEMFRGLPK